MEEEDAADAEEQQIQVKSCPHAPGDVSTDLPYQEQHSGPHAVCLHQSVWGEPLRELDHAHRPEHLPRLGED